VQLQQHAWFSLLPQETLIKLAPLFFVETYTESGSVFRKYHKANTLYFVIAGEGTFYVYDRSRTQDEYSPAPQNSAFGEVGFFQRDRERTATAKVKAGTTLLVLERQHFSEVVLLFPDLSLRLCELMADRMTALDQKIQNEVYIGPFQNPKTNAWLARLSGPWLVLLYISCFAWAWYGMLSDFKIQEFLSLLMGTIGAIFGTLILRFQLEQGKHSAQGQEKDIVGIKRQLNEIERQLNNHE
jgi:CRP-like cAMP-binding protein